MATRSITRRMRGLPGLILTLPLAMVLGPAAPAGAAGEEVEVPGGQALSLERFPAEGETVLIWVPSERGVRPAQAQHARALQAVGYEVWVLDLHQSYFVAPGRASIARFPPADLAGLIDIAAAPGGRRVFLLAESRGAQLALLAARDWQLRHPGAATLAGLILVHPQLYAERPAPGREPRFLAIAEATNLPLYVIEAQRASGYLYLGELAAALGRAGGAVYVQRLAGVVGGFHLRPEEDLEALDLAARARFPALLRQAMRRLAVVPSPAAAAPMSEPARFGDEPDPAALLEPLAAVTLAPRAELDRYGGGRQGLGELRGKVVLLNFWASWCTPCVTEIPSLNRLARRFAGRPFEVVAVNIGEAPEQVARFMARVPIDFAVWLDRDGSFARAWKVQVYPSNFLVDGDGRVRYAHLGALEWDRPEFVAVIEALLAEAPGARAPAARAGHTIRR